MSGGSYQFLVADDNACEPGVVLESENNWNEESASGHRSSKRVHMSHILRYHISTD